MHAVLKSNDRRSYNSYKCIVHRIIPNNIRCHEDYGEVGSLRHKHRENLKIDLVKN